MKRIKNIFNENHGVIYLSGGRLVLAGASLLSSVILARVIGPSELGIFAVIVTAYSYISIISDFGLRSTVVVFSSHRYAVDELIGEYIKIRLLISLLIFSLSAAISWVFFRNYFWPIFFTFSSVFFVSSQVDWISLVKKEYLDSIKGLMTRWVSYFLLISAISLLFDLSLTLLSSVFALSWFLGSAHSWILVTAKHKFKSNIIISKGKKYIYKDLLSAAPSIFVSSMIGHVMQSADLLFVGWRYSSSGTGNYYIASGIVSASLVFGNAISQIGNSTYAKFENKHIELGEQIAKDLKKIIFITSVISLAYLFVVPYAIPFIFGDEYKQSSELIGYFAPYVIFYYIWSLLFSVCIAVKKEKILLASKVISLISIFLVYVAVQGLNNMKYVAIGKSIIFLIPVLFIYIKISREINIPLKKILIG